MARTDHSVALGRGGRGRTLHSAHWSVSAMCEATAANRLWCSFEMRETAPLDYRLQFGPLSAMPS